MKDKIPVIYILSSDHSGSTLTDLILGSHSSIESAGEIDRFDKFTSEQHSVDKIQQICTCGQQINQCQYWTKVRWEFKKNCGKTEVNLNSENPTEFIESNYYLISAILQTSGKKIFCDSSKDYKRLEKFLNSNLFDVHIVHLVRDGRAVAFSLKSKGERTGKFKRKIYNYYQGIKFWKQQNSRYYYKYKNHQNYSLLKYEDLVSNTQSSVGQILKKHNLKFEDKQLEFSSNIHHNIGGNRMRMLKGQKITKNTKYKDNLSIKEWWLGTYMSYSVLRLFSYSLWR